jgi:S1-C subfamily serine protease/thiol-disulfide isomerase/thioredoxin
MKQWLLMVCVWVFIAVTVQAAKFGDPAAPLHVAQWIKGDPVDLATGTGKTVYVVEFWATWCPPCRESIPHLSKLQAKFKDKGVVFVGISDEKQQKVEPFVKKMGAKMEYAVGLDDNKQTSDAYMSAYHQDGIPTAFVIDKTGAVVWAGHPMEDLSKVIEQVLAGTFVVKPETEAVEAEDDESISLLNEYFTAASRRSGEAEAIEAGKKVLDKVGDDPDMLNAFAWTILTDDSLFFHDYPLALRAARQAVEKSGGQQYEILDTLARALLMTGKTNDAVSMQQKAINLCDDNFSRLKLKETLESYLHPVTPDGMDDAKHFDQFVDGAAALIKAKRAVSVDQLLAKTDIQPCRVQLAKASTQPISSENLYEQARQSVLMIGTLAKGAEEDEWDATVATGFVIHESGIFVTNFHVLDVPEGMILAAMTADGKVYPVKRVLAVSPFPDIAICQLDGATGLKPLPIVPNAKPGAHIRVLSHPDNAFYSITEGVLSRYFVRREDGKESTMLTTTAEFAVGSSGGPVFDDCGNVIGMVASTSSVYSGLDEASGEEPTTDSSDGSMGTGDLQMILKMCVPPSDILKLVTGK